MMRIFLWGALAAAVVFGYFSWRDTQQQIGEERATVSYNEKITKQKDEATRTLNVEKAKVAALEVRLAAFKELQEKKDADNKATIVDLKRSLLGTSRADGRLRDPNGDAGCGRGGDGAPGEAPATALAGSGDEAGEAGLLSVQLSSLLRNRLFRADEINNAYRSCRADSLNLRGELSGASP